MFGAGGHLLAGEVLLVEDMVVAPLLKVGMC